MRKKSGWNPIRRNKNIGTKKSGYSQNNRMVVPDRSNDFRCYWENFNDPVICPIIVHDHNITLIVEPTRRGYVHACTPSDIVRILELLPADNVEEVDIIILRQPKKKEEIISPVWAVITIMWIWVSIRELQFVWRRNLLMVL